MRKTGLVILNYKDKINTSGLCVSAIGTNLFDNIVIVDNKSNDGSYEYLKEKFVNNVKVDVKLADFNKGFASGNNIGMKFLREEYGTEILFCMNSDVIFEKDSIQDCINILVENKDIGLITPRMLEYDLKYSIDPAWKLPKYRNFLMFCFFLGRKLDLDKKRYTFSDGEITYVDVVRGSFLCFDGELLTKIDYFDENTFLFNEENIICFKIKQNDYKVAVLNNRTYVHNHPPSGGTYFRFKMQINSSYYFAVNYLKIKAIKKFIYKIFKTYGLFEYKIILFLKKLIGK